jgi:hypothetical protein
MVAFTRSFSSTAMTRKTVVDRRMIIPNRLSISRDISIFTSYQLDSSRVHLFILHKTIEKMRKKDFKKKGKKVEDD